MLAAPVIGVVLSKKDSYASTLSSFMLHPSNQAAGVEVAVVEALLGPNLLDLASAPSGWSTDLGMTCSYDFKSELLLRQNN
jgi:hypothetical protein